MPQLHAYFFSDVPMVRADENASSLLTWYFFFFFGGGLLFILANGAYSIAYSIRWCFNAPASSKVAANPTTATLQRKNCDKWIYYADGSTNMSLNKFP